MWIIAVQIEILVENFHRFRVRPESGEHARAIVNKHVARQQRAVNFQRHQRIGQIMLQTLLTQRQQIRLGIVWQHVHNRPRRIESMFGNGIGRNSLSFYQNGKW